MNGEGISYCNIPLLFCFRMQQLCWACVSPWVTCQAKFSFFLIVFINPLFSWVLPHKKLIFCWRFGSTFSLSSHGLFVALVAAPSLSSCGLTKSSAFCNIKPHSRESWLLYMPNCELTPVYRPTRFESGTRDPRCCLMRPVALKDCPDRPRSRKYLYGGPEKLHILHYKEKQGLNFQIFFPVTPLCISPHDLWTSTRGIWRCGPDPAGRLSCNASEARDTERYPVLQNSEPLLYGVGQGYGMSQP